MSAASEMMSAMTRTHSYDVSVTWTGNRGTGTSGHRAYDRDHEIRADGPAAIAASSDPSFRGDPGRGEFLGWMSGTTG